MLDVMHLDIDRVGVEAGVAIIEPQIDDIGFLRADDRRDRAERAGFVLDLDQDTPRRPFGLVPQARSTQSASSPETSFSQSIA